MNKRIDYFKIFANKRNPGNDETKDQKSKERVFDVVDEKSHKIKTFLVI
jgi:hypothetical protein